MKPRGDVTRDDDEQVEPRGDLPMSAILPALMDALEERAGGCTSEGRALEALVQSGQAHEAHARAADPSGTLGERLAGVSFDLAECSGRRGARRLLALLRGEASRDAHLVPEAAHGPILAWASFRLWRHGRALSLARAALDGRTASSALSAVGLPDAVPASTEPENAPSKELLWTESLEAIRDLALRQGYLGHAREASRLAEGFAALLRPPRDRASHARKAEALETLLVRHRDLSLPSSLLRYLARSLGHPVGDSAAGAAEVLRDLSVTQEHLARASDLAPSLGLPPEVRNRLAEIEKGGFGRHPRGLRLLLRGLRVLFWMLLAGLLVLGITLLMHL